MSTIKDVAALAGVSVATVSNYLNGTKPVNKETAAKVREAVEKLNYSLNFSARSLRGRKYNEIGVILPNFTDSYYIQLFQGIESVFQGSDYFLNLAFSYDIPEVEESIVRNLLRKQICGLITVSCQPESWKFFYDNFTAARRPVVMIDRTVKSLEANIVSFDNYSLLRGMTRKLLCAGYREPCILAGPVDFDCEERSVSGFTDACDEAGIPAESRRIVRTDLNKEDAFRHTLKLLRSDLPDFFIATSESTATGIIEGLDLLGYSGIPVLTLGEEHWNGNTHSFAAFSAPRPAIKMGRTAGMLLSQDLNQPMRENEYIIFKEGIDEAIAELTPTPPGRKRAPARGKRLKILMLDSPIVNTFTGLLKNFEDEADLKADVTILPHPQLYDKVISGDFDVVMYDIPWLPALASGGYLADITDRVLELDLEKFFPDILKSFSEFHGRYFGLPFMYAPQMFYYRKDLFDDPELAFRFETHFGTKLKPPITLKEFNALAEFFTTMTDRIDYGVSVPAAYDEYLAPELHLRLQSYGSRIFDSHGNVVFDNPQTLKAFVNFKRLLKFAKPDYLKSDDVSIIRDFLNGSTAMLITYPAFLTDVYDLRKNDLTGSIGYSLIPGRTPILGGWSFGVSAGSASPDAAFSFLKWSCSNKISNYFSMMGGQTAVTNTYTNDELVKLYPWITSYYDAYSYTKPIIMPELSNGRIVPADSVNEILCKWTYKMIKDEIEVQEAITEIHRELKEMVSW